MRLFIAYTPPLEVLNQLEEWTRPLHRAALALRWLKGPSIHLTLHFMGEVDGRRKNGLLTALDASLPGSRPIPIRIDRLGSFTRSGTVSILWAGLEKSAPLADLHRVLTQSLTAAGFETESRPFSPHITLARSVPDAPGISPTELAPFTAPRPDPLVCQLDHLTLFSSELSPAGARYRIVKEYRFV